MTHDFMSGECPIPYKSVPNTINYEAKKWLKVANNHVGVLETDVIVGTCAFYCQKLAIKVAIHVVAGSLQAAWVQWNS